MVGIDGYPLASEDVRGVAVGRGQVRLAPGGRMMQNQMPGRTGPERGWRVEQHTGAELPHLNAAGHVHMVDVGAKPDTLRTAVAEGFVAAAPAVLALRPPTDGARQADVLDCTSAKLLDSVTITPR